MGSLYHWAEKVTSATAETNMHKFVDEEEV